MSLEQIGKWAFLLGIVVAVIAGFVTSYTSTLIAVLAILGLIIGFLNISKKETTQFLVATIALLVGGVASLQVITMLGTVKSYIETILGNFIVLISAAALVVAIKAVLEAGKK